MSNIAIIVFIRKIFTYTKILIVCLLLANSLTIEAKSQLDVSMFPYPNEYKKDRKVLRNFSVPIMNTAFLKLIKYEKVYSSLKKQGVDVGLLDVTNVVDMVTNFQSTVIILPTISISTNITIKIDEKIVAESEQRDDSNTNSTIALETESSLGIEGSQNIAIEVDNEESIESIHESSINSHEIINIQLLEYINKLPDTNFITNISLINDNTFIERVNSITATNALTFATNISKTYKFDVLDTQNTNVLYSKSITNTNQLNTVSKEAIDCLDFYFASKLLEQLADNSRGSQKNSYVDFFVERKPFIIENVLEDIEIMPEESSSSWTNMRTPVFSISSSKKPEAVDTNKNISTNVVSSDDAFEVVATANSENNSAVFNIGDSIRFKFDLYEEGFVNIVYVSLSSTNMSLLYPNNYNIGYATNAGILSSGMYQVPADNNNIELILREAGLSQVYLIYSKYEKNMYDLTKFQSGGFLSINSAADFALYIENILGKNPTDYIIEKVNIETVDITTENI